MRALTPIAQCNISAHLQRTFEEALLPIFRLMWLGVQDIPRDDNGTVRAESRS
jgi:hypothetical protein